MLPGDDPLEIVWRRRFAFRPPAVPSGAAFHDRTQMSAIPVPVATIGLLLLSNIFMTFAWYGHLKYKTAPLVAVILVSWAIALLEYCFQVPANRIGHGQFSAAELKTIQEVITLSVFAVFSIWYLGEPIGWNHLVGFAFIAAGAFFIFNRW
jgi:uncharacterized protein (DUF486 family)